MSVAMENEDRKWTNLTRSGSVKNLIYKFSGSSGEGQNVPSGSWVKGQEQKEGTRSGETSRADKQNLESEDRKRNQTAEESRMHDQDYSKTNSTDDDTEDKSKHAKDEKTSQDISQHHTDRPIVVVSGPHSNFNGDRRSEVEPAIPKIRPNPKYELFLGSNGTSAANGSVGGEGTSNLLKISPSIRGSMDSLSSRDWDSMSDRMGGIESPPRVFNSPYATMSLDYKPPNRMSDFRHTQDVMSSGVSDVNLFRSVSPGHSPKMPHRSRISNYDSLTRRREPPPGQFIHRNSQPNKRDFIQELTKQLEDCQRRNQFLEAESVVMEKERNQIRFEMRGLLVNNEDLLRTNTQMQGELNRMRERIVELESNNNVMIERFKQMEIELKEAREVMLEANTQEYAFNFLQQSLKNRIDDTEEALKKQTDHSQLLSEKLWLAERNLEELELEKENKAKKVLEFSSNVSTLETELADALQECTQARSQLSLHQKLRADAQMRVEELEESILEKDQELMRLTQIVSRLQGEVTYKLSDKEQTLEEEIQLRERAQLQCKQAERTVEDHRMELQTLTQSRDELSKQLKLAQENIIDLEGDLEEQQENEQRWASKHKRALDQTEQLQMKLIQEKDMNEQLECEKVILERQLRDVRMQMEELQNNRVEVDSINRAEIKAKELENILRTEERSKVVLTNTVSKLERKIQELSDQMEEDHKISTEQKELMTQRIRSLKRQLNEAEEETSRRDAQYRHTQRELSEERESNSRLQRQLLDQHLQTKRNESRQTLEKLKLLDLSIDEEDEQTQAEPSEKNITQV
ncbi:Cingulin [Triplophysa tibetana]|uniref:Cingulin n=1 Tax=Triplophysa tibetana TaxID=1572043 RepID=A0A5A9PB58_9TELE|nr:Cingulin [Triplophysa tibetana]